MSTVTVRYTAAAVTDRGRKRPSNEDAFGYSVEDGVYVVCDGMGGAAAGEIASSIAVDEYLRHLCPRDSATTLTAQAQQAVTAANNAIFSSAERNPKLSGMGTTLVSLLVEDTRVWVLNVGDSRCYRLRAARIEQLSLDHSLVDEQVRLGRMSKSEAIRSPLRNVITRALGTQTHVTPDLFQFEVEAGDLFLLCSDGLSRELIDKQIEQNLAVDLPLADRCSRLVEAAKKAGGHDNITAVLVHAVT